MKRLLIFASAVTLSTSVLAGNMTANNMTEGNDMKAMHSSEKAKQPVENILQDEDQQRLHKKMKLYGISEVGMDARLKMITSDEGRRYHEALEKKQKNAAR